MKLKIMQNKFVETATVILCVFCCLIGCKNVMTFPLPEKRNNDDELIKVDFSRNILSKELSLSSYTSEMQIMTSIWNCSNESLLVELPANGLPFDLEYVSTNGAVKRISGGRIGNPSPPLSLYVLHPMVAGSNGNMVSLGPSSHVRLYIPKPNDFDKMRRIECFVEFVRYSELRDVREENDLARKLYSNTSTLRHVEPELIPGIDYPDENS